MGYKEVFLCSYLGAALLMFVFLFWKLIRMTRRLIWVGTDTRKATEFLLGRLPMTLVVWVWSSFFFGSVIGAIWSGMHWLTR
ncbi:hypothetical protein [Pseudomonas rossensis]|uniref:hypothetical protein n=1 Tax=Pseudomonas rossensis TaxID=2305471 RepID=UPI003261A13B